MCTCSFRSFSQYFRSEKSASQGLLCHNKNKWINTFHLSSMFQTCFFVRKHYQNWKKSYWKLPNLPEKVGFERSLPEPDAQMLAGLFFYTIFQCMVFQGSTISSTVFVSGSDFCVWNDSAVLDKDVFSSSSKRRSKCSIMTLFG